MTEPIMQASHRLCAVLHADCIDPADMEIHLPFDAWLRLWCRLDQLYLGMLTYDGRDPKIMPTEFRYMGIKYKAIAR